MSSWRTTILAILVSLWPQKNGVAGDISPLAARPHESPVLRDALANFVISLDHTGQLLLTVPHCHPLAAPFILFRLKRTGFSGCKVIHEKGGLTITARR
jgi:hypothetical protein